MFPFKRSLLQKTDELIQYLPALSAATLSGLFRPPVDATAQKELRERLHIWAIVGTIQVIDFYNGYYCVKFSLKPDSNFVLTGGPWVIAKKTNRRPPVPKGDGNGKQVYKGNRSTSGTKDDQYLGSRFAALDNEETNRDLETVPESHSAPKVNVAEPKDGNKQMSKMDKTTLKTNLQKTVRASNRKAASKGRG
ncbi:zinc finger [Striga asiatica]|uniref:Zinc finger n=1 Tax=Striga asiatica TaxID=4170 RepID=A0A5A7QMU2_STRAF|nr:zinc finger [Striga asiatica]